MKPYLWAVVCVAVECFGPQMQTVDTPTLSLLIQRCGTYTPTCQNCKHCGKGLWWNGNLEMHSFHRHLENCMYSLRRTDVANWFSSKQACWNNISAKTCFSESGVPPKMSLFQQTTKGDNFDRSVNIIQTDAPPKGASPNHCSRPHWIGFRADDPFHCNKGSRESPRLGVFPLALPSSASS